MQIKFWLILLLAVVGIAGAGLSVAMIVSAIEFQEWGRMILYCVTLAVCVEMTVICFGKLKAEKRESQ